MKAKSVDGEIKCPKCGYINRLWTFMWKIMVKDDRMTVRLTS